MCFIDFPPLNRICIAARSLPAPVVLTSTALLLCSALPFGSRHGDGEHLDQMEDWTQRVCWAPQCSRGASIVLQARRAKIAHKHRSFGEHRADELTLPFTGFPGKDDRFDYSG